MSQYLEQCYCSDRMGHLPSRPRGSGGEQGHAFERSIGRSYRNRRNAQTCLERSRVGAHGSIARILFRAAILWPAASAHAAERSDEWKSRIRLRSLDHSIVQRPVTSDERALFVRENVRWASGRLALGISLRLHVRRQLAVARSGDAL